MLMGLLKRSRSYFWQPERVLDNNDTRDNNMNAQNQNQSKRQVRPVLFSLESSESAAKGIISQLRQFAMDSDILEVSPLYDLAGSECVPQCQSIADDHLRNLKIDAALKLKVGNKALAIFAERIVAFRMSLPNRMIVNVGLAWYPKSVRVPSTGETVETLPLGSTGWQSLAYTMRAHCRQCPNHGECSAIDLCLRSHKALIEVLRLADDMGAVHEVIDESGYWNDETNSHLEEFVREAVCG